MTDVIAADRGVDGISLLDIRPAGDVGLAIDVQVPNLSSEVELGDGLVLRLLSGQEVSFSVDALRTVKTGRQRMMALGAHDELYALSQLAPRREQIFVTMSANEYSEYVLKTRNLKPKYDIHISVGDQFGRRGWTSGEVAQALARLAGMDDAVAAVAPQWVRQVVCRREVSFLEAILTLFRVQRPLLWVRDKVLFIVDMSLVSNFAGDAPTVSNGLLARRIAANPPIPEGSSLRLQGGLGKFRPDKFDGKTWTAPFNLGAALSRSDIEVRSSLLRSMLSGCKCYGGYEFDDRVERGESETHVVKELWLKDVIGNRQLLLFSQERVYRTGACENWSDQSACCNLGIRCNGKGTAVCCGWYEPVRGLNGAGEEMLRCEESLHVYESTTWDVETPREVESHTVISGRAWVRGSGAESTTYKDTELVSVWLDPIEYQIRSFSYERTLGTLNEQITQKRSAVFSDSADCDFWLGEHSTGSPGGGNCRLGQGVCDHFDSARGRCQIGLSCDEYGRLATCAEYTGLQRACKESATAFESLGNYSPGCSDCTLKWRLLSDVKSPCDIPAEALVKTQLIGRGTSVPMRGGEVMGPDGVDPECIVHQEIVRYEQVDANTYRRTAHTLRLVGGVIRGRTESHNLPAASVPSHPIILRRMRVSSEVGGASGDASHQPAVLRSDSNLIDWDNADNVAARVYRDLSRAGVEDTYEIPGELLIPRGTPLLAPADCESELPLRPTEPGVVEECEVTTSSGPDGSGLSTTRLKVRF
ncbi:MAG: hypothetical protein JW759_08985 [Candidatus Coatesbacteria bacterium]|nr:hypothetical protein [Candidatus Coatesbacteria bacterium]